MEEEGDSRIFTDKLSSCWVPWAHPRLTAPDTHMIDPPVFNFLFISGKFDAEENEALPKTMASARDEHSHDVWMNLPWGDQSIWKTHSTTTLRDSYVPCLPPVLISPESVGEQLIDGADWLVCAQLISSNYY